MKPNLIFIGTYRAGTTWIYNVFKEHPEVFIPEQKELMFFNRHFERGAAWYESFFGGFAGEKYIADISPGYLASRDAAKRMKEVVPNVRLIATLRNPADQIWSLYNLWLTRGYTKLDLPAALEQHSELLDNVFYYEHISRYLRYFSKDSILILLYDDLQSDVAEYLKRVYTFLDIHEVYDPRLFDRKNETREPRSIFLERAIAGLGDYLRHSGRLRLQSSFHRFGLPALFRRINTHVPNGGRRRTVMPPHIRSIIDKRVEDDRIKLSDLIGKDLRHWV